MKKNTITENNIVTSTLMHTEDMHAESWKTIVVLLLLIIFAACMSVFVFAGQSLRLDESQSLWQTSRSPLKIINIIAQDVHVPLYHMMFHYWQVFLGNGVFEGRMFSLIFFLLSIPAIYMLGKLAYNVKNGLFAALLLAISPFMNWYGNEIRMYSLFTFLIILNQYFFLKIIRERDGNEQSLNHAWIWYAVVSLFGIYTHYFFSFALVTQGVFYLFNLNLFKKGSLKRFIAVMALLIVAFIPWIYYVIHLGTISNSSPLLVRPTTTNIFNTFSQFIFGFQVDAINTILVSLWPLSVLFGFLALRKRRSITPQTIYFVVALVLPMILAYVVSEYVRPLYLSRYLIFTLPSLYLLLSWVASTYPQRVERIFKSLLVIAMLVTLSVQAVSAATPVKENYRGASDYLTQHATPSDIIVVSAPFTIYPMDYYYTGPASIDTLPHWDMLQYGPIPAFNEAGLPEQVAALASGHDDLWLLLSYDQGYEEKVRLYFDTHYARLVTINLSPGLNLYEYKLRY